MLITESKRSDRGRAKLVDRELSVFLFGFPIHPSRLSQRRVKIDPWGLVIRELAVFAASGHPQGFVLRLTEKDRADALSGLFRGLAG